jgi:hypothetical protein
MRDWWVDSPNVYIISPASRGCAGSDAPSWPGGTCVLFRDGLCELHSLGLKPIEGRIAHHATKHDEVHEQVADTWRTANGRRVVRMWEIAVSVADEVSS